MKSQPTKWFLFICLLLCIAAMFITCKSKKTISDPTDGQQEQPQEEPEIVYGDTLTNAMSVQQNIVWPSLADSPWPTSFNNAQCVTRSSLPGPNLGQTGMEIILPGGGDYEYNFAIGANGEIYVIKSHKGLFAFSPSGDSLWNINNDNFTSWLEYFCPPIVDNQGTIYSYAMMRGGLQQPSSVFAVNPDGSIKWEVQVDEAIYSNLFLGKDGALFFSTSDGNLFALNSNDGSEKWKTQNGGGHSLNGWGTSMPISPDGSNIYLSTDIGSVVALNTSDGDLIWSYPANVMGNTALMVDNAGRIYGFEQIGSDIMFVCLDQSGARLWNSMVVEEKAPSSASVRAYSCGIDWNGWLYVTTIRKLFCYDYAGNLRWRRQMIVQNDQPTLLCDSENRLYLMVDPNYENEYLAVLYQFNYNGIIENQLVLPAWRQSGTLLAIVPGNSLLVHVGYDVGLTAILEIK